MTSVERVGKKSQTQGSTAQVIMIKIKNKLYDQKRLDFKFYDINFPIIPIKYSRNIIIYKPYETSDIDVR